MNLNVDMHVHQHFTANVQLIIWQIFFSLHLIVGIHLTFFFHRPKCDSELFWVHVKSVEKDREREREKHIKISWSNINSCNVVSNNIIAGMHWHEYTDSTFSFLFDLDFLCWIFYLFYILLSLRQKFHIVGVIMTENAKCSNIFAIHSF